MIITQTPVRISLAGGGTDFPDYYREHGGFVIATTIDKYIYCIIKKGFDDKIYINNIDREIVEDACEVKHDIIREALLYYPDIKGIDITILADIPSGGSGLGSSSAMSVGILNALAVYHGNQLGSKQLAEKACELELFRLKKPIGKQDQYITAYGGLSTIDFDFPQGDIIEIHKLPIKKETKELLENRLMLYYTGKTRNADVVLKDQVKHIKSRIENLHNIKKNAYALQTGLLAGNTKIIEHIFTESWKNKKKLSSTIENDDINKIIDVAIWAGAGGAKVCGAGGGGFVMLSCEPQYQNDVRRYLSSYSEMKFRFDDFGTRVLLNTGK